MSTAVPLQATIRTETGKGKARRARAAGNVPAVLYGPETAAESLYCDSKEVARILRTPTGVNTLIALNVEGKETRNVLIRDYQIHPIRRTLLHCDFFDVGGDRLITVRVPINFAGRTEAEKAGSKRQVVMRDLRVRCRPDAIPQELMVDMTQIMAQQVRISEVQIPEGAEVLYRVDQPVVTFKVIEDDEEEEAEGEAEAEAEAEGEAEGEETAAE
jgi:large subunit ribosomal protein L25